MFERIKNWVNKSANKVAAQTDPAPPATYTQLLQALSAHYVQRHRPAEEYVIVQRTVLQARVALTLMRMVPSPKADVLRQRLRELLTKISTAMFDHDNDVDALTEIERIAQSLELFEHKSLATFALSTSIDEVLKRAKEIK